MRYSPASKYEIIRTVEESALGISRTCEKLGIWRSTFYNWYDRYLSGGYEALADQKPRPASVWNKVPDGQRKALVDLALDEPELSPRELAIRFTESQGYFVSEATGLPYLKRPRPPDLSGMDCNEGEGQVRSAYNGDKPALADGLHLFEGHGMGLVLSLDRD